METFFKYCNSCLASCCQAPQDPFEINQNRQSKRDSQMSRVSYGGKGRTKQNSLMLPNHRSKSQISDFSFRGSANSIQPIQEDRVLETLCESTNIEVNKIRGSTVSTTERKKLYNKFQRHSQTQDIFKSEDRMSQFMSDLYAPTKSEMSFPVPRMTTLSMCSRKSNMSYIESSHLEDKPTRMSKSQIEDLGSRDSRISLVSRLSSRERLSQKISVGQMRPNVDNQGARDVLKFLKDDSLKNMRQSLAKLKKPSGLEAPSTKNRYSTVVENTTEMSMSLTKLRPV